jgi:thiol:disulfide interchange protein DsbD
MLLFGFLGGLLLNLMPCIFPVLSIKILGFVEQSAQEPAKVRTHGWVFAGGVLVSFWVLAALLFGFRAAGLEIGWGFQLQSPVFVASLALLFFLMSLNLLGSFELGSRWMGLGGKLAARQGYEGSFLSGVLTVVAATPCSALMTTALGFALTQPSWIGTLILTSVAVGLLLPYLLLSLNPGWLRALPRPGSWMLTFKEALAFPLLLTSLWLLWVLAAQAGTEGVIRVLSVFLLAAFLIWLRRKLPRTRRGDTLWLVAAAALAGLWAAEGWLRLRSRPDFSARTGIQSVDPRSLAWRKFSIAEVEKERALGRPVFVDFTADWCVTCKVNEKLVLHTDYLQEAFERHDVALFRADWTNGDAEITRALAAVGRNSVPVYLWYAPGATSPEILPQLLSAGGIVSRLERAPKVQPRGKVEN